MVHRYLVVPEQVYAERVAGRRTVYLDTNAWSDLSEAKTPVAIEALALARVAYRTGRAIFPLSYPTITELLKRTDNTDSRCQAELMDELSGGVTLRAVRHILDLEVLRAFEFMTTRKPSSHHTSVFTVVASYISDARIEFPEGWTESEANDAMTAFLPNLPTVSLLQQGMRTPEFLNNHQITDAKYVREMAAHRANLFAWASDTSGKLNANKIRDEEYAFAFKRYIVAGLPRLVELEGMEEIFDKLREVVRKPGRAALRALMDKMPAAWLNAEMHVQRSLSSSDVSTRQEFYDHDHAAFAVPYTDAFVTSDGGLLDILRRSRASDRFACRTIRGIDGLNTYLEELNC